MREDQRRLAAIMFTDIVGYAELTQRDESSALESLAEHRGILRSIFPKFGGEEVKTMGDGFLVEFASALEAARCAVEIQKALGERNSAITSERRLLLRIGIHVGDILRQKNDIIGDGVNIASRIEALAEPGGICVSQQVFDQVQNKLGIPLMKIGRRELKNIRSPVEIYKIVLPQDRPHSEATPLDGRRIAVLPLANMSANPDDKYFADGMTEEIISTISKIGELSVISRTSVMRYRESTTPIGQIGQELNVGTILEGSVRKSGNRVRITAQLIDVERDRHLWSQSYDRELDDVFAIQSDIARQVAESLKVQLLLGEKKSIERKATENLEAYTLYLKGRYYWNERTEAGVKKAIGYFEEAIKRDQNFARAYVGLADCYLVLADWHWMSAAQAAPKARAFTLKALEISDALAEAHATMGLVLANYDWDFPMAEKELKRAIELNPNYATAHQWYGIILFFDRRYEEALERERRASELDPFSRVIRMNLANALFFSGRQEEAFKQYKLTIELNPDFPTAHVWLAQAYLKNSMPEKAVEETRKAVELSPGDTFAKSFLGLAYGVSGLKKNAMKLADELVERSKQTYVSSTDIAVSHFGAGNTEEAFKWLLRAVEERENGILYIRNLPAFERFREDPRWVGLEQKMGLKR